jgi:hypothetical protein
MAHIFLNLGIRSVVNSPIHYLKKKFEFQTSTVYDCHFKNPCWDYGKNFKIYQGKGSSNLLFVL